MNVRLPDLGFPMVTYGLAQTPWSLKSLLYRDGAQSRTDEVAAQIDSGKLGAPLLDRLPLVKKLHEELVSMLAAGFSEKTVFDYICKLRQYFSYADRCDHVLTIQTAAEVFHGYSDHLLWRVRTKTPNPFRVGRASPKLQNNSAYQNAAAVSTLLDRALNLPRPLMKSSKLSRRHDAPSVLGVQSEKQNLADTFEFGHLLQDLCDALTLDVVLNGTSPISIRLRNGSELLCHPACIKLSDQVEDPRVAARFAFINLRIEAELLMLIGQSGMNLEQAHNLELRDFKYSSYLDGYLVREYKNRRGGQVLFEIFKEYRPHFEIYLAWRRELFPNAVRLFPFLRTRGALPDAKFGAHRLRKICRDLGLVFIPPMRLRNTRVNWMLRQSGDPNLTAEIAQHTEKTLLGVYHHPSLQRAMVQVTRFWTKLDPKLRTASVGPGSCAGLPNPVDSIPKNAPKPDCQKPSGCLWCKNHRDIDSEDYVWALASFGHLKKLELSKQNKKPSKDEMLPVEHAVGRVEQMLEAFEQLGSKRIEWVAEARTKVNEGDYHPDWSAKLLFEELVP